MQKLKRRHQQLCAGFFLLLTAALGTMATLGAQQGKKTAPTIKELLDADQADRRGAMSLSQAQWKAISDRDAQRRRIVHQMLESGTLKTGADFEDASVIFQHGDKPQDYLLAHVLAMTAMAKGDGEARWIAAATLDRYLQSIKQPQVFGTQYKWTEMKPKPHGATQAPYDKDLLSDALRRESCVATYAGQQKNVAAMAQGKDFPSPDGCPDK